MTTDIIVLNGGSSSGKTSVARCLQELLLAGVRAMVRAGTPVILDDVFLGGSTSQERLRAGLDGLQILWVGVHCEVGVAVDREAGRADRAAGMAASQAQVVHQGVGYDVEVDTTRTSPVQAARLVLDAIELS